MTEIPAIIEQLKNLSQVPITSNTDIDILPESDEINDLKQQLNDLRLIHSIVYWYYGDRNLTSQLVKDNLTEQLACLIYFELSRGDINEYFSEIKTEQYSSFIGNYIVEKIVLREKKDFVHCMSRFVFFAKVIGVPLIKNCDREFLTKVL